MKTKNNFTIGVLSGICITLFLFIIMGSSSPNETANYEFYDLKDTRGIIFNKVTGEIKYEEIREEALQNVQYMAHTSWSGSNPNFVGSPSNPKFKHIK